MKGIVIKDLLSLKGFGKTAVIILVAYAIFSIATGSASMMSAMVLVFSAMLPMTATALDEQSKWNVYAQCMPLSRKQIVKAKYLMVLIVSTAALVISLLVTALGLLHGPVNWGEAFLVNGGVFCMLLVMCAITLPLMYKLGVEKARLAIMLVYLLCIAPFFIILNNAEAMQLFTAWWAMLLVPLVAMAVFLASYFISVRIYRNKEF